LTVLLRAASSTDPNAHQFVQALIEHPAIDLYVQDPESGWNALHRSLYAGNVSIARLLLEKERVDLTSHNLHAVNKVGLLIKTKDHEGNSPFDVYNSTIAARSLKSLENGSNSDSDADSVDSGGDGLHQ
jgi:ankyrin repeat protein